MSVKEQMFCFIRYEICGEEMPENVDYNVKDIFLLAKSHDLAHLVADAALKNGLASNNAYTETFEKERLIAVLRETRISYLKDFISEVLSGVQIPFIPLKGAIIRGLYPESWMRTSCDIDILVKEKDIKRAAETLVKNGFTTDKKMTSHHMHLFYVDIHLELHFSLVSGIDQIDGLLDKVWEYSEAVNGSEYHEKAEYYAFHHIAHMAYHFLSGGCGVRPFIDLWILKNKKFYDEEKLIPLLKESNLVTFYEYVCALMEAWLCDGEYNEITLNMEKFILSGGVYGTEKNLVAVDIAANNGSKIKYVFKRAFPPYREMCITYPILKKCRLLLPFCYVHKIMDRTIGKNRNKARSKVGTAMRSSDDRINVTSQLLKDLDLRK